MNDENVCFAAGETSSECAEQIRCIVETARGSAADILHGWFTVLSAENGDHVIILKAQLLAPADGCIKRAEILRFKYIAVLGQNGFPDLFFHSEFM